MSKKWDPAMQAKIDSFLAKNPTKVAVDTPRHEWATEEEVKTLVNAFDREGLASPIDGVLPRFVRWLSANGYLVIPRQG